MAEDQNTSAIAIGEEESTMLQSAMLLLFCLLVGVLSLAICVWVAATGQLLTMDGLLTIAISLAVGAVFMANIAWSFHSGELKAILRQLRRRRATEGLGQQLSEAEK